MNTDEPQDELAIYLAFIQQNIDRLSHRICCRQRNCIRAELQGYSQVRETFKKFATNGLRNGSW